MNIDLTKPQDLPDMFLCRLKEIDDLCSGMEFSEELVERSSVCSLVRDIDKYCEANKIIGIHYTRAVPENISNHGLLIRDGKEIRSTFLSEYGHRFSNDEIVMIKESWDNYFSSGQVRKRDGRVFFNFTELELGRSGTEKLLGLYGGEQVGMCFNFDDPIGAKLANIGEPLVVRCALDPFAVNAFIEHPWGKILVSAYHLSINREAYCVDQDGYQSVPVKPEQILEVRTLTTQASRMC